jgi:hypothetical protein
MIIKLMMLLNLIGDTMLMIRKKSLSGKMDMFQVGLIFYKYTEVVLILRNFIFMI